MSVTLVTLAFASALLPPPSFAASTFEDRLLDEPRGRLERFSNYATNAVRGVFAPNPNWFLSGIDFSCVSPWNSVAGRHRAGTAISRRHVIFARHYPLGPGARLTFVGTTGQVSHYTIKATKALETCDIQIAALDADLTPDIRPAKVLPVGFETWLKDGTRWPTVTFTQDERAYLSEISCKWNTQSGLMALVNTLAARYSWRKFGGSIIVGDSGNPAFLLYDERPILVYCLLSGGVGHGPFIHHHRAEIQRVMNELAPGYRLEDFDFAPTGSQR